MPKYCSNCKKEVKDEYLKYCPKCMEELTFIYSRQGILDDYEKKLDETSNRILEIKDQIRNFESNLKKVDNHDEIIDLKYKIDILGEKIGSLENKASSLRKDISIEKSRKRKEKKEIIKKEKIYMEFYINLTDENLKILRKNNKFKNKSKNQITKYFIKNNNWDINKMLNELKNFINSANSLELLYKELYVLVDDDLLRDLCDYFSIEVNSKEKVLKKLIKKYSRNSIFDAIAIIQKDNASEIARKDFYDKLMTTLDSRDVSLFCRKFDIDNPSKHKVIDFLVENYTEDEIDFMKIELYNEADKKQKEELFFQYVSDNLEEGDIKLISKELKIKNQDPDHVINYIVKNLSKEEFDLKINEIHFRNSSNHSQNNMKSNLSDFDDERNKMNIVIKYLKEGNTYDEAAKMADISPNLIEKWRKMGLKKVNDNTVYFYNELRKIESAKNTVHSSKDIPKKSYNDKNGSSSNKMKGLVKPEDISHVSRPKLKDSKFVHPSKITNNDFKRTPTLDKIEVNQRTAMDIISLMNNGYDRRKACEEAGVSYGLFLDWYNAGARNISVESRNFWSQIQEIESSKKPMAKYTYLNKSKNAKSPTKAKSTSNQHSHQVYNPKLNLNKLKNSKSEIKGSNVTSPSKVVKVESNRQKVSHEKTKIIIMRMERILSLMDDGYDRRQACKKAGVSYELFLDWYNEGARNISVEFRNFWSQIQEIESSKKPMANYNYLTKSKKVKSTSKSILNSDQKNKSITKSKEYSNQSKKIEPKVTYNYSDAHKSSIKYKNNFKRSNNTKKSKVDVKPKITNNVSNSKLVKPKNSARKNTVLKSTVLKKPNNPKMNEVLSLMKKGNNRLQAARKANVEISQILTWYKQGSKNYDEDTINFYNQIKNIEKK